ncbi:50S ribosomal protein L35 [Mycoplasma sp. (ex Biomphalaria glabrata)]|uniref:50S ribosomal protein L35 n=1 Tax=Mycoplasma sp. (ex Biomphalaria glabrata) TaxID=1749074 RepID=UPI00073A7440|nr:50S ribosomal protein L35 [Mycoplasma sp. (ex Biomphalaria glabrata)]ALV23478.1 50S ribosomal protein L35 [Mycoplasma sp. (ex Biomphalaria glabrata)]
MAKIKMKTKKAIAKRVKVTKTGQLKRASAYTSHLSLNKSTKQKRQLRKGGLVHKTDIDRLKRGLPYSG